METIIYSEGDLENMIPFVGVFSSQQELDKELFKICNINCSFEIREKISMIPNSVFLFISGRSKFEDSEFLQSFYNDLVDLSKKSVSLDQNLVLVAFFDYFNSGSIKAISNFLSLLNKFFDSRFHIFWLSDDESYLETGEYYKEFLQKKEFTIKEIY